MLRPGSSELPSAALTPESKPHAQMSLQPGAPLRGSEGKSPFSQPGSSPKGETRLAQAIFARAVLEVYI